MDLSETNQKINNMFRLSITFFIIAIVAAIFGFGGIAASLAGIAKIVFFVALALLVLSLVFGKRVSS